jgi:4-amino-4-deoxy-L-arabinose transferase-like glycosyltransferase
MKKTIKDYRQRPMNIKSWMHRDQLVLLILVVAGLLLRLFHLEFRSIWLDEAYSLRLASASLSGIFSGAVQDIHPPLFYLLLAGWIRLFGSSEFALRSLSAVFGAGLIPVVFVLTRSWVNKRAAFLAAALITCSPYFIELSRSGRMAAQLIFFSMLSIYFFWKILERGNVASFIGYGFFTLAAIYTHYFAFLPFFAQHLFIFMGIGKLNLSRSLRKHWMLLQMFILAGFAPWLTHFWDHLNKGGPSWRGVGARWWEPVHSFYTFLVGTACWTWWNKMIVISCLGVVLVGIAFYATKRFTTSFQLLRPRVWGLLFTLILVPIGAVWAYSMYKLNVFDNRYLGVPAGMLLILLASLLSLLTRWKYWLANGIILLAFLVPLYNQYFVYGYYDNWREVAAHIKTKAQANDCVAVYPAWNETPLDYYLQQQVFIQGIPGSYDPITGKTERYFHIDLDNVQRLESIFLGKRRVWLVLVNPGEPQRIVRQWFGTKYTVVSEQLQGGIRIIELHNGENE